MRKYHLKLADGTERDLVASNVMINDGALILVNDGGELMVAYGPDSWVLCELETRDDRE